MTTHNGKIDMSTITVEPLTPAIGAVVGGVDAARPLDEATIAKLRRVWLDRQVIFLRDQHLTPEQFKRFGAYFGELDVHPFHRNLGDDLEQVQEISFDGSRIRNSTADLWHVDGSYLEHPTTASLLTPVKIPEIGGDTAFASMHAAYTALPESLQRYCEELYALHSAPRMNADDLKNLHPTKRPSEEDLVGRVRPVVIVHPETGRKTLYVNRMFTRNIVGFAEAESRHLLDMLYEHTTYNLEFQVRHRWRMGDIAIWDNRATIHYGVTDYREMRTMRRLTIKGGPLHGVRDTHDDQACVTA